MENKLMKPELLAPVGGKPHLIAAVNNGADAVYMGGMAFNARIFADNFSDEELPDAIRYAHMRGVKVYMTLNTLVRDDELVRAFEYANYIYGIGVDGLIVQGCFTNTYLRCLCTCRLRELCTTKKQFSLRMTWDSAELFRRER